MRNPDATSFPHQRIERNGDTAGRSIRDNRDHLRPRVQVGLAVGHDDQGSRHVGMDLSSACKTEAEQDRPDEFVNRDEPDQQQLDLCPPPRKLGGDDGGESEGDP